MEIEFKIDPSPRDFSNQRPLSSVSRGPYPIPAFKVTFQGQVAQLTKHANHSTSFVLSASIGKVLDYECLSKICNMCTQKKASMSEEEFEAWQDQHACDGNFGGSSPSMELEAAKRFGEDVKITSNVISS